ncbi:hypothetical protein F5B18DRAFT_373650 [Nemania serpens]|nr:hypothetical protein F5B18DRAFT_373650 [Nemania serpens]
MLSPSWRLGRAKRGLRFSFSLSSSLPSLLSDQSVQCPSQYPTVTVTTFSYLSSINGTHSQPFLITPWRYRPVIVHLSDSLTHSSRRRLAVVLAIHTWLFQSHP